MNKAGFEAGKVFRASFILLAALVLAMSAGDSRARSEGGSGFLYSDYMLHTPTSLDGRFSVTGSRVGFWRDAFEEAELKLDSLSFGEYFAEDLINDGDSVSYRMQTELLNTGWELGADILEEGAHTAADRMLGRTLKHLEVEVETKTGRGLSNIGVNAIGAIHGTRQNALSWQLRGYSGFEDSRHGLNLGGVYRFMSSPSTMLGGNIFLDYESFDKEGFFRLSGGGELRTPNVDLYGNYYSALTDVETKREPRHLASGTHLVRMYSSDGFDFEAHFHTSRSPVFTGILGYYKWWGELGEDDESGGIMGFRWTPLNAPLELRVDYRTGEGRNFGGDLSYIHSFGVKESTVRRYRTDFSPQHHFYAPVEREYTQRISRVIEDESTPRHTMRSLDGIAMVRGVEFEVREGSEATVTMVMRTDLRLESVGNVVVMEGTLQSRNVGRVTLSLPWNLPPVLTVELETMGEGTALQVHEVRGDGINVVMYDDTEISFGGGMVGVRSGRVEILSGRDYMVEASDSISVSLTGGSQINVNTLPGGGEIVLGGGFRMTAGLSIYMGEGDVGLSLTYGNGGEVTETQVDGLIEVMDRIGGAPMVIEPLEAVINPVSGVTGSGTFESPLLVRHGHEGLLASLTARGGSPGGRVGFEAFLASPLSAIDGMLIAEPLTESGTYRIVLGFTGGTETGLLSIYVRVPAPEVTTPSPVVTVTVTLGMLPDEQPGMTMAMTMTMSTMTITVIRPTVTMTATMPTMTISPMPGDAPTVMIFLSSDLSGNGRSSSSPLIVPGKEEAMEGQVLATLSAINAGTSSSPAYSLVPGSNFGIDATSGVLTVSSQLMRNTSYTITVSLVAEDRDGMGVTVDASLYVTVANFEAPSVMILLTSALSGSGSSSSPLIVPGLEETREGQTLATLMAVNAGASSSSAYSLVPGSSFGIDAALGILTVSSQLMKNTSHTITAALVTEDQDGMGVTVGTSLYVTVSNFVVPSVTIEVRPSQGVTFTGGDGMSSGSAYVISYPSLMASGVELVEVIVTNNMGTVTYSSGGSSTLSLSASTMANRGVISSPTDALEDGDSHVVELTVEAMDLEGMMVTLLQTVYFQVSKVSLEVVPAMGLSGMGTSGAPIEVLFGHAANAAIATLSLTNGGTGATIEGMNAGGALGMLEVTGVIIRNTQEVTMAGMDSITLVVMSGGSGVLTLTVHVEYVSDATAIEFIPRVSGEGTSSSPLIVYTQHGANSAIATLTVVNGVSGVTYSYSVASGSGSFQVTGNVLSHSAVLVSLAQHEVGVILEGDGTALSTTTVYVSVAPPLVRIASRDRGVNDVTSDGECGTMDVSMIGEDDLGICISNGAFVATSIDNFMELSSNVGGVSWSLSQGTDRFRTQTRPGNRFRLRTRALNNEQTYLLTIRAGRSGVTATVLMLVHPSIAPGINISIGSGVQTLSAGSPRTCADNVGGSPGYDDNVYCLHDESAADGSIVPIRLAGGSDMTLSWSLAVESPDGGSANDFDIRSVTGSQSHHAAELFVTGSLPTETTYLVTVTATNSHGISTEVPIFIRTDF